MSRRERRPGRRRGPSHWQVSQRHLRRRSAADCAERNSWNIDARQEARQPGSHGNHRLRPQHARGRQQVDPSGGCRARQGGVRGGRELSLVPPRQRKRLAHRTGSDRNWPHAVGGRASAGSPESELRDVPDQSPGARGHEGRQSDQRAASQRGHLHRAAHGRQGAARFSGEGRPPRLHHPHRIDDALIRRQADAVAAGRCRGLPSFIERTTIAMVRRRVMLLALLVCAAYPLRAQVTYERLLRASEEARNWLTYSGSYRSQRHTPLRQIDPGNVKNLEMKWVYQANPLENFEATPLVVDGIMYFTSPINDVVALDATTGRLYWIFRYTPDRSSKPCCGSVNRGLAIHGDLLYLATLDAHLIALDSRSGKPVWDVKVGDVNTAYTMTLAPLVVKNKVVIGVSGGEYGIRGFVAAFDL